MGDERSIGGGGSKVEAEEIGIAGRICRFVGEDEDEEVKIGRLGGREGGAATRKGTSTSFWIGAGRSRTLLSVDSVRSSFWSTLLVTFGSSTEAISRFFIAVTALNTSEDTFGGGEGPVCDQLAFERALLTTSAGSSSASCRAFSRSLSR